MLCSKERTAFSGCVSRPLIRDMLRLRFSALMVSIINSPYRFFRASEHYSPLRRGVVALLRSLGDTARGGVATARGVWTFSENAVTPSGMSSRRYLVVS
jgi:hypothetical protein